MNKQPALLRILYVFVDFIRKKRSTKSAYDVGVLVFVITLLYVHELRYALADEFVPRHTPG